jgi:Na+-transporting NADH:ubiquinone oxidoreductase subunit C
MIDGLSGATLTGNGVTGLVQYWTGPHGFGPYLKNYREDRQE